MTVNQAIIRRTSGGEVVIETPKGLYPLSPENLRNILFYGQHVPILPNSGDADREAVIFGKRPGFNGARRIFFVTAGRSFSIADVSFVSVVKGKWAAASMVADQNPAVSNV
jgi:hypothetical protein